MFNSYTLTMDLVSLQARFSFELSQETDFAFGDMITPANPVLVVTEDPQGRLGSMMHWGLVPNWSLTSKPKLAPINARVETLTNIKMFRSLLYGHRCLIPADSFYVWPKRGNRNPVRISLKSNEAFAFAGVWEHWPIVGRPGEPFDSFTVITLASNPLIAPMYDRMPAVLPRSAEAVWLSPDAALETALSLLKPFPAGDMLLEEVPLLANGMPAKSPELAVPGKS